MSTINNTTAPGATSLSNVSDTDNNDFNNKVLDYLEQNKPQGTLREIMEKMRALSPDKDVTTQQLNSALLYADATLRKGDSTDYTDTVLDKRCTQLLCLNSVVSDLVKKIASTSDDIKEAYDF